MVAADASFVVNPHLYSKLSYDPINEFVPVSGLGISPQALVLHPSVPVNTFRELIAYAKTKPGEINYGTFGIGTSGHLNILHIAGETGAKFTPIHYRGAAPAITDLLGGHIQMMIVAIGLLRQNIDAAKLKALGIGSRQRLPQYPDLPTLHESGLPDFEAGSWYGFAAPKGTPREIVERLSAETQKIFGDAVFRDKFLAPAVTFSIASPPEAFAERIRADLAKWGKSSGRWDQSGMKVHRPHAGDVRASIAAGLVPAFRGAKSYGSFALAELRRSFPALALHLQEHKRPQAGPPFGAGCGMPRISPSSLAPPSGCRADGCRERARPTPLRRPRPRRRRSVR